MVEEMNQQQQQREQHQQQQTLPLPLPLPLPPRREEIILCTSHMDKTTAGLSPGLVEGGMKTARKNAEDSFDFADASRTKTSLRNSVLPSSTSSSEISDNDVNNADQIFCIELDDNEDTEQQQAAMASRYCDGTARKNDNQIIPYKTLSVSSSSSVLQRSPLAKDESANGSNKNNESPPPVTVGIYGLDSLF
eukprot:CAMPEP_0202455562 /NCGR_PEP_ID=MMETSP1360-20130828/13063_1 /ASSEMBLY_ACC=CAM_ASM_000848 /TAXON_ID=515479 /ORGANISM="Licmophora paradoxa, Strain CCMP2313" /LENGTH=191 /DNA_ID=CAMNT_0049075167 /DNA_START=57 /DNA_END=632 /DNA_ORIENTATION=+